MLNLTDDQISQIKKLKAEKHSIRETSQISKIPYSHVWFYAVNSGIPLGPTTKPKSNRLCHCGKPHHALGLCFKHYREDRYQKNKNPS